ncbi:MAG: BACON domain-containing protein, partial [bacterium]|nr:BACON domain-containing protein [bacterium]
NSTTGYPDGNYAIRAIAYDKEGHSSEDSITVTLSNGAAPPSSETITTNRSHLDFKARKIRTFFGKKVILVALPKLLLINTNGNGNLNWTVSTDDDWLSTFPKRGKGSKIIVVYVKPKGMSSGTYSSSLNVMVAGKVMATVTVELEVE